MRTRNTPTNIPPNTSPGVTQRVAELTGMVEPSGFSDDTADVAAAVGADDLDEQRMRDEHVAEQEAREAREQDTTRRLTPIEEAYATAPTREAEQDDLADESLEQDTPEDEMSDEQREEIDGFAEFLRDSFALAVMEKPATRTSPEERAVRGEALRNAIDILGPASSGAMGAVQRPVAHLVYVAEWLLDSATPVHLPGSCSDG